MIAVTGATGHLGRSTLQALAKRAPVDKIVAIVRDPHKGEDLRQQGFVVRRGDYDDPASMVAALFGVDRLLLISSNALGARVRQHEQVVAAAAEAGVSLLAYTSLLHCDTARMALAAEHRATEACIRRAAIPYVILRNGWYLENYDDTLAQALQSGALIGCAQGGRISAAARADYAAAAAVVLTEPGHMNKTYELAGDSALSLEELAALVCQRSGKTVRYQQLAPEDYLAALQNHAVPPALAHMLVDSDRGIARGELHDTAGKLSQLIGRPTAAWDSLVARVLRSNEPSR
jgi:NAD(P)H dehydrogenase (quinone)